VAALSSGDPPQKHSPPTEHFPDTARRRQVQVRRSPTPDHPDPPTPSTGGGIPLGARRLDHGQREGVPEASPHPRHRPHPSRAALPDPWDYRTATPPERRQTAFSPQGHQPTPRRPLPVLDLPEEASRVLLGGPMPCAAEAVRTSCSWSILKLMHASINAGGDACIDRRPTPSPVERVQPKTR
jgi:hypothetical protein